MSTAGLQPIGLDPSKLGLDTAPEVHQRQWGLAARVDPTVSFEEYQYWAKIERAEEKEANAAYKAERGPVTFLSIIKDRFSSGYHAENAKKAAKQARENAQHGNELGTAGTEKGGALTSFEPSPAVTEEEWKTAARAMRTAGWGTIFYLITTDILGWSTTPFVFASLGYGPAAVLYLIFGLAAALSGYFLWKIFLGLDSTRFPMMSFGDTYFRVFGSWARHFINVSQALQQFMTVSVLILGSGTTVAQLSNKSICFIVCFVIVMVIGMALGSIRSLQRLGWLCNLSVWLNIVSFIIIMVAVSHNGPDYDAVVNSTRIKTQGNVRTFAGPPPDEYQQQADGFAGQFNGINSLVYSWGGALLFIAFLAEMRHPWDFWKGMLAAQVFIGIVYVFFGAYVYGHFGQYSISNIGNAIEPVHLQQAGNIIGLITGFIACLLYFNIGMKTVYIEVFESAWGFPAITTKKGRWMWYILGPLYWVLAFIIAAAVPNINGIAGLVGALMILNFTYTFPAIVYVGYSVQQSAALPGEGFDPRTGITTRHDSGFKRWTRGYNKRFIWHTLNVLYACGGAATSGMGTWAAVEGLIAIFGPGGTVATSFGCQAAV